MISSKKILLSFIGLNDAGNLIGQNDGAIITALKNEKFDEVILLWNKGNQEKISFQTISNYLFQEISKRGLAKKVRLEKLNIKDVTDHNEIYILLKEFTDTLLKNSDLSYTAAISSGTPAMQVCWILLAESGDFSETNKLRLIKVTDPRFGQSRNIEVKIASTLPKIIRLKKEINSLKKSLIPKAIISKEKATLHIDDKYIPLSPIELSYYMYFVDKLLQGKSFEKFTGISVPDHFLNKILDYHQELFPDLESNRYELKTIQKKKIGLSIYTFRGNISKLNKKIKIVLENETLINSFIIQAKGNRGAKFYGIDNLPEKFIVEK